MTEQEVLERARQIRCQALCRIHADKAATKLMSVDLLLTQQEKRIIADQFAELLMEITRGQTLLVPNTKEIEKARELVAAESIPIC